MEILFSPNRSGADIHRSLDKGIMRMYQHKSLDEKCAQPTEAGKGVPEGVHILV